MDELVALLCSESIHVESKGKSVSSDLDFAAMKGGNNFGSINNQNVSFGNRASSSNFRGRNSYRDNRGGRFNNFHGGCRGGNQNPNFHQSQSPNFSKICEKPNYTALDCWYIIDSSFQSTYSQQNPYSMQNLS